MSFIPRIAILALLLLAFVHEANAQGARFFRISGPGQSSILAFRSDGALVWINALAGTYTVQVSIAQPAGTNWVNYLQISATNGLNASQIVAFTSPASMAFVPAGVFTMGDTLDGDSIARPVANVFVSAFFMDVNLISYAQWQGIYAWAVSHGYQFDHLGSGKAPNHPVQTVTWYDVVKWNNARSQKAGLTPAYYLDAGLTEVYTNGNVDAVYVNWSANGYRLPTEAEWEKAARGGLIGQRFPWGNIISENLANYDGSTSYPYDLGPNGVNANFESGGYPYTSPVGSFLPNGYGLYDMAGNVVEWCWDWYAPTLSGGSNPHGPNSGLFRTYRGGFWGNFPVGLRVCQRRSEYGVNSPV
jgi:formylglycine-generating enzyme required for sulfatase activity